MSSFSSGEVELALTWASKELGYSELRPKQKIDVEFFCGDVTSLWPFQLAVEKAFVIVFYLRYSIVSLTGLGALWWSSAH